MSAVDELVTAAILGNEEEIVGQNLWERHGEPTLRLLQNRDRKTAEQRAQGDFIA